MFVPAVTVVPADMEVVAETSSIHGMRPSSPLLPTVTRLVDPVTLIASVCTSPSFTCNTRSLFLIRVNQKPITSRCEQ